MAEERVFPGADERSPSRPQYFSWINNTNEGSTEAQTLANLEFFRRLHDEFGMRLEIYAFDAGNIDGFGCYGSTDSERFREQFPRGFGPVYDKSRSFGCRLGMWGGPDGFGDSPGEEQARVDMMAGLCREFDFALFKFDSVCGGLRPEKRDAFITMMKACREASPDLILLNHRLELGHAEPYATTFLFEGAETYIDVHMPNSATAPHHRAAALSRALVPGLRRLTEDHGVCLSSCLDYWEDDLVLQAFNRCLILAPEIYGNPWLLRDDELPKLARIYNLHYRNREILVDGIVLPEDRYGPKAVSRGDGATRFVTMRNLTWEPATYRVRLGPETGLAAADRAESVIELRRYHPSERILGRFAPGDEVAVEVAPFRSCLLMATSAGCSELGVEGCDYEVVHDVADGPATLELLGLPGTSAEVKLAPGGREFTKATLDGRPLDALARGGTVRVEFPGGPLARPWHRRLGALEPCDVPPDAEALYESTCFAADSNALEVRSLRRSGPTRVPEVQAARDAFFAQPLFGERGIWDRFLFDGDMTTCFRRHEASPRLGGALRVDMGECLDVDRLVLRGEGIALPEGARAEVSADLAAWRPVALSQEKDALVANLAGLASGARVRYFRMDCVPAPLAEVEGYAAGEMLDRSRWRASNLFEHYRKVPALAAWRLAFSLDEVARGSYLALALEGRHGIEGAFAALRVGGRPVGAPDRAVSFPSNVWEYRVREVDSNYTYYFPASAEMVGARVEAVVLVMAGGVNEFRPEAWLTAYPTPFESRELVLTE